MGIPRIGPRLTMKQQISKSKTFRDRPLALQIHCLPGVKDESYSPKARDVLAFYDAYVDIYKIRIITPHGYELDNARFLINKKYSNEDVDAFLYRIAEKIDKEAARIDEIFRSRSSSDFDEKLNMISVPPGRFIFQEVDGVYQKGFQISETVFTNGHFQRLWELFPNEIPVIFDNPMKLLKESLKKAGAMNVFDCPFTGDYEADEIESMASLIGKRLPTEVEWERAAAYISGLKFPWADKLIDETTGTHTKSVYSNKDLKSPDGIRYQIGIAELTSSEGNWNLSNPSNPKLVDDGEGNVLRGFVIDDNYHLGFRLAKDL